MGKGHMRRPSIIPVEEADLKWDVAFAETQLVRDVAQEALDKYYKRKKKSYIEKTMLQ